jgi:hypothetical protein
MGDAIFIDGEGADVSFMNHGCTGKTHQQWLAGVQCMRRNPQSRIYLYGKRIVLQATLAVVC